MTTSSVSRRRFLQIGGALAAGGVLATPGHIPALAGRDNAAVTLKFWTPGGSKPFCNNLNVIEQQFEKIHPDIQIEPAQCYGGQLDYRTVLLARIAAGNPPDATIYWSTPVSLGQQGALEALDDLMAHSQYSQPRDWPAAALASCQFSGKTWGLPLTGGSYALWNNAEWFAKKGIPTARDKFPKTWDDLRKLSKEFTQWNGDTLVSAGYVPMANTLSGSDLTVTFYVWAALNGGQVYDAANHKYTIDADANVAMMEYMVSWLNEEYHGNMTAVNRSGNWSGYADSRGRPPAFQSGQLAMLEQGFWFTGDFYAAKNSFNNYEVASYPVGPGGSKTTSGFWPNWAVIPHGAAHPEQAFQWLDYLGGVGIKQWFSVIPDLPTNLLVPQLVPAVAVQKRGAAYAADVTRFFHHQLSISIPLWNSPVQDFATDQILKAIGRIMNKVVKPKEGLAEAQRACQSQLSKVVH